MKASLLKKADELLLYQSKVEEKHAAMLEAEAAAANANALMY